MVTRVYEKFFSDHILVRVFSVIKMQYNDNEPLKVTGPYKRGNTRIFFPVKLCIKNRATFILALSSSLSLFLTWSFLNSYFIARFFYAFIVVDFSNVSRPFVLLLSPSHYCLL